MLQVPSGSHLVVVASFSEFARHFDSRSNASRNSSVCCNASVNSTAPHIAVARKNRNYFVSLLAVTIP